MNAGCCWTRDYRRDRWDDGRPLPQSRGQSRQGVPLNRAIAASVAWLEERSRVKRNIDVGLCAHDEHAIEGPALDGLVAG